MSEAPHTIPKLDRGPTKQSSPLIWVRASLTEKRGKRNASMMFLAALPEYPPRSSMVEQSDESLSSDRYWFDSSRGGQIPYQLPARTAGEGVAVSL